MASLGLGIIGFALGGPLGGFIGAGLGSAIDSMLFAPKIEGPRLSDLKVTSSAYGQLIPLIYGPDNRVAGNIIWSSGLKEKARKKSAKGGPTYTEYTYSVDLAIALGEGQLAALSRIWANGKLIYENGSGAVFRSVTFYPGSATQMPDPTIESALGVGNAPAYRHTAYVVIRDLQLADFGNAVPNLTFDVAGMLGTSVSAWVEDIAARAGTDPQDIDVSDIVAWINSGRGYAIATSGSAWSAIEPLSQAYGFDVAERAGRMVFFRRDTPTLATVPTSDMGAQAGSDRTGREPLRIETEPPIAMPREVAITFRDPALDYQENTQRASRQSGSSQQNIARELPLVLSATEGQRLADEFLWDAWAARRTGKFALSDRWHELQAGMAVALPAAGLDRPFRVTRATRGANGVIDFEARHIDLAAYRSTANGIGGTLPPNEISLPGETILVLMDAPILRDADDDAGFYWAVTGPSDGWRGAVIMRSTNGGISYGEMSGVGVRSVIGTIDGVVGDGPADVWDRGTVITVNLLRAADELESRDEADILDGMNGCWIGPADGQGGEILQFATAELVAPGVYELSDLLRGRKGTDHAIASHGAGEMFVLFNSRVTGRSDFGPADWNAERLYKPVSVLTLEEETPSQAFTGSGEGKRPLSPVGVSATRNDDDDLTISWHRRSRLMGPGLFGGDPPLGEESEAWEIDVLDGSDVVRTISTTTSSAAYSAAEQTADGLTPGDPVTIDIHQMSVLRGRGHPRRAVV